VFYCLQLSTILLTGIVLLYDPRFFSRYADFLRYQPTLLEAGKDNACQAADVRSGLTITSVRSKLSHPQLHRRFVGCRLASIFVALEGAVGRRP
jgi:hypothetical protein